MNPAMGLLASGLLAPLMALLPVLAAPDAPQPLVQGATAPGNGPTADLVPEPTPDQAAELGLPAFATSQRDGDRARQVRIEQRVIIRITPGPMGRAQGIGRDPRRGAFADFAERQAPRFVERRMGQCVPAGSIAGVQPDGADRLILFMRDQRIVSAALEKGCNARDFYSGFMIERTSDGQICASRDKLLSRTGTNCTMSKLRQLVEVDPDE